MTGKYLPLFVTKAGIRIGNAAPDHTYIPSSTEEETTYIVTIGAWGSVIQWMKDRNGELINLPQGTLLT